MTTLTYIGGSGDDGANGIAVQSISGSHTNIYVTGGTDSGDLPVKKAYQKNIGGNRDAFIFKYTPDITTSITINDVWTSNLRGNRKKNFNPGAPILYNVHFTLIGNPPQKYHIAGSGKANNKTGAAWQTNLFRKKSRSFPGSYTWSWSDTVPLNATPGSKSKISIKIRVKGVGSSRGKSLFNVK